MRFWLVNLQAFIFEALWLMINLHPQNLFFILDHIRLKSIIMMNRLPTVTLITLRKSHFTYSPELVVLPSWLDGIGLDRHESLMYLETRTPPKATSITKGSFS